MASLLYQRIVTALVSAGVALAGVAGSVAPASAQTYQGMSNHNIRHVRRDLERDIFNLQHDARDYGGHRVAAINELQAARNQLLAAEEFRHDRPYGGFSGAAAGRPNDRAQWSSDRNVWMVRRNLQRVIGRLDRDAADYGGHKMSAINDLRQAVAQLGQAERFAHRRGN